MLPPIVGELNPVRDAELFVQVMDVRLHGSCSNAEPFRDGDVSKSSGNKPDDLPFARAQQAYRILLLVDLAIYGAKQREDRNDYQLLEDGIARVDGIKTLISYNYYDEETFWRIWNKRNYMAVKKITDPDNVFRGLYDKTCLAPHGR